jgi:hypothetical protein
MRPWRMKVILVFDPRYGARDEPDLRGTFWLIESPENRALARRAWAAKDSDPNSAVFKPEAGVSLADQVLARFADIKLHHPHWTEIAVVAAPLTADIDQSLSSDGHRLVAQPWGFSVLRSGC